MLLVGGVSDPVLNQEQAAKRQGVHQVEAMN
jgi:hypothetical protein